MKKNGIGSIPTTLSLCFMVSADLGRPTWWSVSNSCSSFAIGFVMAMVPELSPEWIFEATSGLLEQDQLSALAADVAWLDFRAQFRRMMISQGYLRHPWRSIFEADMIFSLVGQRWLQHNPITLKEVATHFEAFTTEVTIKRHIDDMEAAGTLRRVTDPKDRRRLLLVPTPRLVEIARHFLSARVRIALEQGFVYDPQRAAEILASQK